MIIKKLPIPLKTQHSDLLGLAIDKQKPPQPIIEINDDYCVINNNATSIRNLFLIPWLIGLLITGYWFFDSQVQGWQKAERSINRYIAISKKMFGDDYFKYTKNETDLSLYNRIGPNGKLSFREYLDYKYTSVKGDQQRIIDIIYCSIFLLGIPFLIYYIVRFPRRAPLYFDRKNQRVFSWRKGKVMVQRFEDLRIHEDIQALTFVLRGEMSYGVIGWNKYLIQPSGNPFINNVDTYKPILACVVQFMKHGKPFVYENGDFNRRKPFYFFEDKKPADFEEQVDYIFRYIDQKNDEPPLDDRGYPIKIDLKALNKSKHAEIKENKKKRGSRL